MERFGHSHVRNLFLLPTEEELLEVQALIKQNSFNIVFLSFSLALLSSGKKRIRNQLQGSVLWENGGYMHFLPQQVTAEHPPFE